MTMRTVEITQDLQRLIEMLPLGRTQRLVIPQLKIMDLC